MSFLLLLSSLIVIVALWILSVPVNMLYRPVATALSRAERSRRVRGSGSEPVVREID